MKVETEHHEITVTYFNTDDGIWLICTCGWERRVGFFPSPGEVLTTAATHWEGG